jgi:redox-sensitive bicupin YhaK (pirin superfamily)
VKPTVSMQDPATRKMVQRTRGLSHGPIVRLISPSDLGERLKPFVFLDLFEADMRQMARSMPIHPHSGIATVTVFADGDVTFDDPQAGKEHWAMAAANRCVPEAACGTARNFLAVRRTRFRASSSGSPFRRT